MPDVSVPILFPDAIVGYDPHELPSFSSVVRLSIKSLIERRPARKPATYPVHLADYSFIDRESEIDLVPLRTDHPRTSRRIIEFRIGHAVSIQPVDTNQNRWFRNLSFPLLVVRGQLDYGHPAKLYAVATDGVRKILDSNKVDRSRLDLQSGLGVRQGVGENVNARFVAGRADFLNRLMYFAI